MHSYCTVVVLIIYIDRIPVGVNPQNLRNYTLYDILGLGGEWGAAADTDGMLYPCMYKIDNLEY